MKKLIAVLLALFLLASCKSSVEQDKKTEQTTVNTTAQTAETTKNTDATATDDGVVIYTTDGATVETGEDGLPLAASLYETVTKDIELPFLESPYLEEMVPSFIGDVENTESFVIKQAAISAFLTEIIIVEAKEGKADEVYNAVDAHFTSLKNSTNLYPQGMEAVAAAIIGKKGNIIYFFCNEKAAELEKSLLGAL